MKITTVILLVVLALSCAKSPLDRLTMTLEPLKENEQLYEPVYRFTMSTYEWALSQGYSTSVASSIAGDSLDVYLKKLNLLKCD